MNILLYITIPIIAVLVVHWIMWLLFRDKEKKDKGFVLFYQNLTYRRRLIRTLWNIPIVILLYLFIFSLDNLSLNMKIVIGIIFLVFGLLEATYNYVKWRKFEKVV